MPVAVIIPTYNRLGRVLRAVDSVLRQSFADFELIVVDDGSTDDSARWLSRYHDSRLRVFTIPHGGVAKARNHGVKNSCGEWLCFLDSDDVWRRHKLSVQIRYHAANPDSVISQTDDMWLRNSVHVNKLKKHMTRTGDIFRESLKLCLVCASSVMIRRDVFENAGGFDETLPTCEDYDLWLRITASYPVGFVAKTLVTKFGGHKDQLSKQYPVMDQYRLLALEKLANSNFISVEQRRMVAGEIAVKQAIVAKGAGKMALAE